MAGQHALFILAGLRSSEFCWAARASPVGSPVAWMPSVQTEQMGQTAQTILDRSISGTNRCDAPHDTSRHGRHKVDNNFREEPLQPGHYKPLGRVNQAKDAYSRALSGVGEVFGQSSERYTNIAIALDDLRRNKRD
jgi:hypothetical protein